MWLQGGRSIPNQRRYQNWNLERELITLNCDIGIHLGAERDLCDRKRAIEQEEEEKEKNG
jgi:hypothetical protein